MLTMKKQIFTSKSVFCLDNQKKQSGFGKSDEQKEDAAASSFCVYFSCVCLIMYRGGLFLSLPFFASHRCAYGDTLDRQCNSFYVVTLYLFLAVHS